MNLSICKLNQIKLKYSFYESGVVLVVCELEQHQRLETVLENRQVFEFLQEVWDRRCRDEETSEKHEGDNQHGCQSHSELLVTE